MAGWGRCCRCCAVRATPDRGMLRPEPVRGSDSDTEAIMPVPPKHPSVRARRNDPKKDFTTLSASGLKGPAPAWPLLDDPTRTAHLELAQDRLAELEVEIAGAEDGRTKGRLRREQNKLEMSSAVLRLQIEQSRDLEVTLWDSLWAMPQAVMWAEAHAHREVAQYVRWKIRAEQGDMKAASEARQWSDRLGLNPLALLRLRVEIEQAAAAEDRGRARREKTQASPKRPSGKGEDPRAGLYAV